MSSLRERISFQEKALKRNEVDQILHYAGVQCKEDLPNLLGAGDKLRNAAWKLMKNREHDVYLFKLLDAINQWDEASK